MTTPLSVDGHSINQSSSNRTITKDQTSFTNNDNVSIYILTVLIILSILLFYSLKRMMRLMENERFVTDDSTQVNSMLEKVDGRLGTVESSLKELERVKNSLDSVKDYLKPVTEHLEKLKENEVDSKLKNLTNDVDSKLKNLTNDVDSKLKNLTNEVDKLKENEINSCVMYVILDLADRGGSKKTNSRALMIPDRL